MSVVLTVRALDAWYGAAQILHGVAFDVRRGEVLALMGRNGAGKSTTLKSVMGLVERRRGEVVFMGHDIARWPPHRIARAGLGYVPEDRRIFTDLTVAENLDVGRQPPRTWPGDGTPAPLWTPESLFALFPNLATMTDRSAARMSGGEQQMLTVARTLMGNPYCVLLDEPSEGVAPLVIEQMAEAILALKAQGTSIVLSEQNWHFAHWVADRAVVLERGELRWQGTMAELAAADDVRRAYLSI